jgi:hypothetical protein
MNEMDKQFWTGFLKGIMACEHAIEAADEEEVAIMAIRTIKQRAERLCTEDVLGFLSQYKVGK